MNEVKVRLRSGEDEEEVLMAHVPKLREEINRQGRIWRVVGIAFLATRSMSRRKLAA